MMSEPTLELTIAQVEVALEEGDFVVGRQLLAQAHERFGEAPELLTLDRRLDEVEKLAVKPEVDEWVRKSQDFIRVADYQNALEALRQAIRVSPRDQELRLLLERTEKASGRHSATLERQQASLTSAREVASLLDTGDLQTARERLMQARGEHGRQQRFDELEERLLGLVEAAQRRSAGHHLERAETLLAKEDWRGALHQADLALALAPGNESASSIREQAHERLSDLDNQEQKQLAFTEIQKDVERFIAAGEMPRADERLRLGVDALGRDELFDQLAEQIDAAKKDQEFRRRIEWRERRAKEAEALVQEAARRAQAGDFAGAVQRVTTAQELDPSFPGINEKLEAHRTDHKRQLEEERQTASLERVLAGISAHLDNMRLEEAAKALRLGRVRFGDEESFDALERRLDGLHEADADVLPTPSNLESLSLAVRGAIRAREKALAEAYSWKQAFTVAFRPDGLWLFLGLAVVLMGIHGVSELLPPLDFLTVPVALLVIPAVCVWTLAGKNHLAASRELWPGKRAFRDAGGQLMLVVLSFLPAWGFVASREVHGLFGIGPVGWCILALLLWAGGLLFSVATGVGLAFGWGSLTSPRRLAKGGPTVLAVAVVVFVLLSVTILLRTAVEPELGVPLAALFESYGLLTVPHLIGVMVRSRRLDWAEG